MLHNRKNKRTVDTNTQSICEPKGYIEEYFQKTIKKEKEFKIEKKKAMEHNPLFMSSVCEEVKIEWR